MHLNPVLASMKTEFVRPDVTRYRPHVADNHPYCERVGVMVASPLLAPSLDYRRVPELAPQMTSVSSSNPRASRSRISAAIGQSTA